MSCQSIKSSWGYAENGIDLRSQSLSSWIYPEPYGCDIGCTTTQPNGGKEVGSHVCCINWHINNRGSRGKANIIKPTPIKTIFPALLHRPSNDEMQTELKQSYLHHCFFYSAESVHLIELTHVTVNSTYINVDSMIRARRCHIRWCSFLLLASDSSTPAYTVLVVSLSKLTPLREISDMICPNAKAQSGNTTDQQLFFERTRLFSTVSRNVDLLY